MHEITVLVGYLCAAALLAGPAREGGKPALATLATLIALAAIVGHGWLLFNDTLAAVPGSLSLGNAASLTGLMLAVLALAFNANFSWRGLIAFFLATAGFTTLFTSPETVSDQSVTQPLWQFLSHVLLATLAWSLFAAAATLALLTVAKERYLRHAGTTGWAATLPPLESMERLMFGAIGIGFGLLSLGIFSGLVFVDDLFGQHLTHKTVLSLLAWLVFAGLLFGRWRLGWRGRRAVNWTVGGFALLALGYFGSRIVLEVVLGRQWG